MNIINEPDGKCVKVGNVYKFIQNKQVPDKLEDYIISITKVENNNTQQ